MIPFKKLIERKLQKKYQVKAIFEMTLWCRREGSNLHVGPPTRP